MSIVGGRKSRKQPPTPTNDIRRLKQCFSDSRLRGIIRLKVGFRFERCVLGWTEPLRMNSFS
jgi:hypothetical protein